MNNRDNMSDEEIVLLILKGDKDLFEEIVKRYESKLKRYILRITYRRELVDDILQNVFIKIYKNLYSFDKKLKFSSWIYRITHNEAINFGKAGFMKKFISLDFFYHFGTEDESIEKYEKNENAEMIKKSLDKLDTKYREPLYLFYFEDKNYGEISDILRVPVKTVGTLIHRAKLKIKENYYED
jgi:RNA polymerase sigma-70 factor (ECF subfamily)